MAMTTASAAAAIVLSKSKRRRAQTSNFIAVPQSTQRRVLQQHHLQPNLLRCEQDSSSIENVSNWYDGSDGPAIPRGILSRGASADRSSCFKRDCLQQKLKRTSNHQLNKHSVFNQAVRNTNLTSKEQNQQLQSLAHQQRKTYINLLNKNSTKSNAGYESKASKDCSVIAWSSTSSLLKAFNEELSKDTCNFRKKNRNTPNSANNISKINQTHCAKSKEVQHPSSALSQDVVGLAGDANRINLNIVLEQTIRATNDIEVGTHSDVESCSEVQEQFQCCIETQSSSSATTSSHRRAQFQSSHNTSFNATTLSPRRENGPLTNIATTINVSNRNLIVSNLIPVVGIQTTDTLAVRRHPFVRAMSAPVRCTYEDNNHHNNNTTKNSVLGTNKRKKRNRGRKAITRNISCDKSTIVSTTVPKTLNNSNKNDLDDGLLIDEGNKKLVTRTRSTTVTDVITLVSLIDTELSDSEKEDDISTSLTSTSNLDSAKTTNVRAPLLRKTVSFQENFVYPPNYQLAAKEYSHMIRRGSVAPLVTRLRTKVRSAPPASIFISENEAAASVIVAATTTTSTMIDEGAATGITTHLNNDERRDEHKNNSNERNNVTKIEKENILEITSDMAYPQYVRSLKERECWKLYQKMSNKGVNISYETVLRGMLTPTEFRQVQKQREIEDSKLRALEELEREDDKSKKLHIQTTAIERLSETLLQK